MFFVSYILSTEKSSESAPCKRKRCQVDLDGDMDFQSSSQSTYKPPDVQYMGRQLKMHFRVEQENCNVLKGRSWTMTLPQVSMVFSSHLIIRQYTFIQMTRMWSS